MEWQMQNHTLHGELFFYFSQLNFTIMTDVMGNPQNQEDQKDSELNEEKLRIETEMMELKEKRKNIEISELESKFENADLTALMTGQQVSNEENQLSSPMTNIILFVGCFKNHKRKMFVNRKDTNIRDYYLFVIDSLSIVKSDSQSLFRKDSKLLAFLQFLKDLKSEIL